MLSVLVTQSSYWQDASGSCWVYWSQSSYLLTSATKPGQVLCMAAVKHQRNWHSFIPCSSAVWQCGQTTAGDALPARYGHVSLPGRAVAVSAHPLCRGKGCLFHQADTHPNWWAEWAACPALHTDSTHHADFTDCWLGCPGWATVAQSPNTKSCTKKKRKNERISIILIHCARHSLDRYIVSTTAPERAVLPVLSLGVALRTDQSGASKAAETCIS